MNPKIKLQEEWLVMRSFRENYPEFPKGKLTKSESPDFLLKLNHSKSIGIEISRIFKSNTLGTNESEMRSVIYRAHELYSEHLKIPVFAWIYVNNQFIGPINQELYATKIAIAVIDAVEDQNGKTTMKVHLEKDLLPDGLNRIIIYAHPTIKNSYWDCRSEITISDLFKSTIPNLIRQKDEKLNLYRKQIHDFYWLILYADFISKPASSDLDNIIEKNSIKSAFNNVFLYHLFDEKFFLVS
jgi:hypothetical protein